MLEAFFLPAQPGMRFCLHHSPRAAASRGIVYVHPFAEEMNKSRRMAALQSGRLAAAGYAVLQIDLMGCGDSSGDFGEASWETWKNDVRTALAWLGARVQGAVSLWGLRLGATLAAEVAADASLGLERLLLWQPVLDGEQFLVQFLRLRLAAEMLGGGASQSAVGDLRGRLAAGQPLEIAGYELAPELAAQIARLRLASVHPAARIVHWLDLSPTAALSPAARRAQGAWRDRGLDLRTASVTGDPFWATVEIAESASLLEATTAAMAA